MASATQEKPKPIVAAPEPSSSLGPDAAPIANTTPVEKDALDVESIQLEGAEDPRQWTVAKKWRMTAVIALMGFISPLGSSIVIAGASSIDQEWHIGSRVLSLLPLSLFVLGLGMGPFCLAPASELKGRQVVYMSTSVVFILFNIGTATVKTFPGLLILRFLAGVFGSAGPSLGAGSIGDMFIPTQRGRAQSLYALGPLLGPVVGNIVGGWISEAGPHYWRWLLWTLTILSGVIALVICVALEETFAPVLLRRKRQRIAKQHLQQLSQANSIPPETLHRTMSRLSAIADQPTLRSRALALVPGKQARTLTKHAFSRPFRLLFLNPICAIFSLYLGFCYGIIFLFLVEHPLLYEQPGDNGDGRGGGFHRRQNSMEPSHGPGDRHMKLPNYGWRSGPTGLTYAGLGLGFLIAALLNATLQDRIYQRLAASRGKVGWFLFKSPEEIQEMFDAREAKLASSVEDVEKIASPVGIDKSSPTTPTAAPVIRKGRPEYRLPLCLLGMLVLPCGLLLFGWCAQARSFWLVPLLGSILVGMGTILPFQSILCYVVDAFIPYSASATACTVLVRSVLAAVFPLFAQSLYNTLGFGWGSSLLALVAMLGIPAPLVLFRYGESLRTRFKFNG